jgi:hypothetical protein
VLLLPQRAGIRYLEAGDSTLSSMMQFVAAALLEVARLDLPSAAAAAASETVVATAAAPSAASAHSSVAQQLCDVAMRAAHETLHESAASVLPVLIDHEGAVTVIGAGASSLLRPRPVPPQQPLRSLPLMRSPAAAIISLRAATPPQGAAVPLLHSIGAPFVGQRGGQMQVSHAMPCHAQTACRADDGRC